jgi:hypothetical protein
MLLEPELSREGVPLVNRGPYNHITSGCMNRFYLWPLRVETSLPVPTAIGDIEVLRRDF